MGSLIDKYSKTELEQIVLNSFSYAEVLSRLGYSTSNGRNNNTLKDRLKHYNISTEHFKYYRKKCDWTDDEIFCEDSKVSQNKLRRTFKERNFAPYKCDVCGIEPIWNGKPLVLTLDHKNGRHKDNRIENLHWVCPNCDRQLDTYGTKNKKNLQKDVVLFSGNYIVAQKQTNEIEKPSRKNLKDKLWETKNYTQVANYYNVSPTQIRRWCRQYDLPATIHIIKHTTEDGWINENWNDFYESPKVPQESIACCMLDKETGEFIKDFPSRKEAIRYLGVKSNNADAHIGAVCNGKRKTAYGYQWRNKIESN